MARILIAEHNETTAAYIAAALKKKGHAVSCVDNSLDAWRAFSQVAYDVMIVDVIMPGIDGFVLAQKALQMNPLMQVVFVTGFAAVAMDTGATPSYAPAPFTSRPFHLKNIVQRVRALMGQGLHQDDAPQTQAPGMVVYADFANRTQALSSAQQ
jgi:two-component system cell cycle response regulator CpdR